jgi:hypothetical protein
MLDLDAQLALQRKRLMREARRLSVPYRRRRRSQLVALAIAAFLVTGGLAVAGSQLIGSAAPQSVKDQFSLYAQHRASAAPIPGQAVQVMRLDTQDALYATIGSDGNFYVTEHTAAGAGGGWGVAPNNAASLGSRLQPNGTVIVDGKVGYPGAVAVRLQNGPDGVTIPLARNGWFMYRLSNPALLADGHATWTAVDSSGKQVPPLTETSGAMPPPDN